MTCLPCIHMERVQGHCPWGQPAWDRWLTKCRQQGGTPPWCLSSPPETAAPAPAEAAEAAEPAIGESSAAKPASPSTRVEAAPPVAAQAARERQVVERRLQTRRPAYRLLPLYATPLPV